MDENLVFVRSFKDDNGETYEVYSNGEREEFHRVETLRVDECNSSINDWKTSEVECVALAGFPMPSNCRECPCVTTAGENFICGVHGFIKCNNYMDSIFRPAGCPLVYAEDFADELLRDQIASACEVFEKKRWM